jgi:hypothetical protein
MNEVAPLWRDVRALLRDFCCYELLFDVAAARTFIDFESIRTAEGRDQDI